MIGKEPWRSDYERAARSGAKVAILQVDGTALACANWDGHLAADVPRCLGLKYEEFMDKGDVIRLRKWLADKDEAIPITYRQLMKDEQGKPVMRWVTIVKRWRGTAWLCYGALRP